MVLLETTTADIWIAAIAAISGVITAFLGLWINKLKSENELEKKITELPKIHNDEIIKDIEYGAKINQKLKTLLNEFECDRIIVYEFHNGDYFYHNRRSIQKYSAAYEVVSSGIETISKNYSNVLISAEIEFFNDFINNKIFFYTDINDIKYPIIKSKYEKLGVKSCYSLPLYDIDSNLFGFVSFHYIKSKQVLSDHDISRMKYSINMLTGYMDKILNK
jgi:hypothetical protein